MHLLDELIKVSNSAPCPSNEQRRYTRIGHELSEFGFADGCQCHRRTDQADPTDENGTEPQGVELEPFHKHRPAAPR